MTARRLLGLDGDLFDSDSAAYHDFLLHLREQLLSIGFVVDKKRDEERTLRVYPVKRGRYPLLNPILALEEDETSGSEMELLMIFVLSKGDLSGVDDQLGKFTSDDTCRFAAYHDVGRAYTRHGHFEIPLTFSGPRTKSRCEMALLTEPLRRILRSLT